MNNFNYKNLTPFKWFVLENFPFIEADFDALTEWQLFCKLGKEINKIINSTNTVGTQVETLTDYVSNYFDNLDVQEEINNKLNEMAQSGQLTEIIAQYLQLAGLLCFNTLNDMKNAENLVNGSFVKTFGTNTYNDGLGNFYKIRNILNTDIVDNVNIIALTNYNNLIAELIPNAYINDINNSINVLKNKNYYNMIMLGDSFGDLNDGTINRFFYDYIREGLGLTQDINFFPRFQSGAGFRNGLYLANLQAIVQYIDRSKITDIFICGGWNDSIGDDETYNNQVETFNNYVKQNFPNAKITIAHISWGNPAMTQNYEVFMQLPVSIKRYINTANKYGYRYLKGVENILHDYTQNLWQNDGTHLSQAGQELLGTSLVAPFLTGSCSVYKNQTSSITASGIATNINNVTVFNYLENDFVRCMCAVQSQGQPIIFECDGTTINLTGSNNYIIGSINSPFLSGFSETNGITLPVNLWGTIDGSDNSFDCMATFFIDKNKLYFKPLLIASKNFKSISINKIVITDFGFSIPSIIA